jgi:asparagine synthase (glutamine-hydrolysing)
MCGIAGFLDDSRRADAREILGQMLAAIAHRGPDDSGMWFDREIGLALGHRRLSILDLSPAGHQPMQSASGRWVIVFNGEIYNHLELRVELEEAGRIGGGCQSWRGHSDTETLLAGFEQWGVRGTLERLVGMFAFVAWDRERRTIVLGRDRFGEKPLYYGFQNGAFLFSSELKALHCQPAFEGRIDRAALSSYMEGGAVAGEGCIFEGVRKLLPGTILTLQLTSHGRLPMALPPPVPYWRLRDRVAELARNPWKGGEEDAISELEDRILGAVRGQMVADVPVGAFLSGGVDSSAVVALMQSVTSKRVRTFTIGFSEQEYDESRYALAVARHLGTDHTSVIVSAADAQAIIPRLPEIYDEPFADVSQIPTILVATLAKRAVTVALSGDGGDELFGGYSRHAFSERYGQRLRHAPRLLRSALAGCITGLAPETWDRIYRLATISMPAHRRLRNVGEKLYKVASILSCSDAEAVYRRLTSKWESETVVLGEGMPNARQVEAWEGIHTPTEQMMAWDSVGYLPDDILVKVDRAAMSVSLETRIPMLDHRVAEFSWRLPLSLKVRNGTGKWILRKVLYRHVPQALIERPKAGFAVPIDTWLRGPLRAWAEDLLEPIRLKQDGYLDAQVVQRAWRQHLSGTHNNQYQIWNVLMFQSWLHRRRSDLS